MTFEGLNEHYMQPFSQDSTDFRKYKKGRKRVNCTHSTTMWQFIQNEFVPKWRFTLSKISLKQRELCISQKRPNFMWKEFLKDLRNFYRLMFRLRFHRSDKRSDDNSSMIVETILKEIGISVKGYDNIDYAFQFFYKVHYNQRKGVENYDEMPSLMNSNFRVFEEYSDENRDMFLDDYLGSRLVLYFIANYGQTYLSRMSGQFKEKVQKIMKILSVRYSSSLIEISHA